MKDYAVPEHWDIEDDIRDLFDKDEEYTVFISEEELSDITSRDLYGKIFEESHIIHVFPKNINNYGIFLCTVEEQNPKDFINAVSENGHLKFQLDGSDLPVESYDLSRVLFSRNLGILDSGYMVQKHAIIIGCGSVGSLVALELARSGVGNFLLIDADIIEAHNICRHQCSITEVGDTKVHALSNRIRSINPEACVETFAGILEETPQEQVMSFIRPGETIFIGCGDNRAVDVYANRIAIWNQSPFISIGLWERAFAGEIFYWLPNRHMPCYECALGSGSNISKRTLANHHVYSNEENLEAIRFEPGLSTDISFVTLIGVKLALDILNINTETYRPRLLNDLQQYTLIATTSDPEIGGSVSEIFSYPLQVSRSLMVDFRNTECNSNHCCKYEIACGANL